MNTAVEPKMKTEVTEVEMKDGRKVGFAGARQLVKSTQIDGANVSVRLDFRNGETRLFPIPASLLLRFAGHGAEQKLGDNVGGVKDVEDAVLATDELIDQLNKGEWRAPRAAGEANPLSGASDLLKALVEHTGKSVDEVKAKIAGWTLKDKIAVRNSAAIKPIIERLEAAKAKQAAPVDTGALLGQL